MANFITKADFIGEINISQNQYTTEDLQSFIDEFEVKYLKKLLGDDLYLKVIDPEGDEYDELIEGVVYETTNENGVVVNVDYTGIRQMLAYFIYFEYIRKQPYKNTNAGTQTSNSETATAVTKQEINSIATNIFNKAVDLYGKELVIGSFITGAGVNTYDDDYWNLILKGSCYNYLDKHEDLFPTWNFTPIQKIYFNGSF